MNALKTFFPVLGIGIAAVFALTLWGCGDNHDATRSDLQPALLSVSPGDNAAGVNRDATIRIHFNMPMDTASVRRNFHLTGGEEMEAWMDSLTHHRGMGGMDMINMGHMMDWIDSIQYSGQFHWDATMETCEFTPDSAMMPDADHMIYLYDGVKAFNTEMMEMNSQPFGGMVFHFRTGL